MKTTRALSLSIFFLFVFAGMVSAGSLPTNNPFRLEGAFTVDGAAPTQDYSFSAYVNGELYKTLEEGADGYYVITVGGEGGDTVSLYVNGVLAYDDVDFDSYGTHKQAVNFVTPGTGGGGSGGGSGSGSSSSSGGSGSGGGSSGGGSGGGGSAQSARTLLGDATGDAVAEGNATSALDVAGNTSVSTEEENSSLSAVTGVSFLDSLSNFGKGKAIFVILLLAILAYFLYRKLQKGKKVIDTKAEVTPVTPGEI